MCISLRNDSLRFFPSFQKKNPPPPRKKVSSNNFFMHFLCLLTRRRYIFRVLSLLLSLSVYNFVWMCVSWKNFMKGYNNFFRLSRTPTAKLRFFFFCLIHVVLPPHINSEISSCFSPAWSVHHHSFRHFFSTSSNIAASAYAVAAALCPIFFGWWKNCILL